MYISPLMLLAEFEALALLEGDKADLTGGTSTCWMPLRAWSWALILAAAAAFQESATLTTTQAGGGKLVRSSYPRPRPDQRLGFLRCRRNLRRRATKGFYRGRHPTSSQVGSATGGRIETLSLARVLSGRSGSALRFGARCHPSRDDNEVLRRFRSGERAASVANVGAWCLTREVVEDLTLSQ